MAFPVSPTDGQTYINGLGTSYTYVSDNTAWKILGTGSSSGSDLTGSGTATYLPLWADSTVLSDSPLYVDSSSIVLGSTTAKGLLTLISESSDTTTQNLATNVGLETASSGVFTRAPVPVYTRKDQGILSDDGVLIIAENDTNDDPVIGSGYAWASTGFTFDVHQFNFSFDLYSVSIFNGIGEISNSDSDGSFCIYLEDFSGKTKLVLKNRLDSSVNIGYSLDYFKNPDVP